MVLVLLLTKSAQLVTDYFYNHRLYTTPRHTTYCSVSTSHPNKKHTEKNTGQFYSCCKTWSIIPQCIRFAHTRYEMSVLDDHALQTCQSSISNPEKSTPLLKVVPCSYSLFSMFPSVLLSASLDLVVAPSHWAPRKELREGNHRGELAQLFPIRIGPFRTPMLESKIRIRLVLNRFILPKRTPEYLGSYNAALA